MAYRLADWRDFQTEKSWALLQAERTVVHLGRKMVVLLGLERAYNSAKMMETYLEETKDKRLAGM
jgi:hypothetical protein